MYKLDLEKAEVTDQIANIRWIIEKARQFQKDIYFCFIDYVKTFDCAKQIGRKWKHWQILSSWAPKSLQMVTAAMKLKDACSLEEKL